MRSAFRVWESVWLDTKKEVKHIKNRKLKGYVAHNEDPAAINIILSGPDDRGVSKDIIIDVTSLTRELKRLNLV